MKIKEQNMLHLNMKTNNLLKQESFCQATFVLCDKSAAYRDVYSVKNKTTKNNKRSSK
jgi:hypothetical protein